MKATYKLKDWPAGTVMASMDPFKTEYLAGLIDALKTELVADGLPAATVLLEIDLNLCLFVAKPTMAEIAATDPATDATPLEANP